MIVLGWPSLSSRESGVVSESLDAVKVTWFGNAGEGGTLGFGNCSTREKAECQLGVIV